MTETVLIYLVRVAINSRKHARPPLNAKVLKSQENIAPKFNVGPQCHCWQLPAAVLLKELREDVEVSGQSRSDRTSSWKKKLISEGCSLCWLIMTLKQLR